ncbi:MAG: methyl-accepting chemotaxis protein, partial [Cyanobacteria bacterium P01_F01_bin.3]
MASGTDYAESYQAAEKAYMQGSYEAAAQTIDQLAEEYPTDPSVLLLKGHIYCYGLHQYEVAQQQYKTVLHLSSDPEFVDYANNGLAYASQTSEVSEGQIADAVSPMPEEFDDELSASIEGFEDSDDAEVASWSGSIVTEEPSEDELGIFSDFASSDATADELSSDASDVNIFASESDNGAGGTDNPFAQASTSVASDSMGAIADGNNPFNVGAATAESEEEDPLAATLDMPFGISDTDADAGGVTTFSDVSADFDMAEFDEAFGDTSGSLADSASESVKSQTGTTNPFAESHQNTDQAISGLDDFPSIDDMEEADDFEGLSFEPPAETDSEDKTFFMSDDPVSASGSEPLVAKAVFDTDPDERSTSESDFGGSEVNAEGFDGAGELGSDNFPVGDAATDDAVEDAYTDSFDDFDDFESVPDFDLSDSSAGFTSPSIGVIPSQFGDGTMGGDGSMIGDDMGSSDLSAEHFASAKASPMPVFNKKAVSNPKPRKQGSLAPIENASMTNKRLMLAGSAGVLSAIAVGMVSLVAAPTPENGGSKIPSLLAGSGTAGIVSFASVLGLGFLMERRTKETVNELQIRFNQVSQGDLNARATIFTRDEFGQLSEGFNQMASAIFTTTSEAQRKAQEQEQAKEDLQRQVIRLLDDVEGAARGDLTVKAEVTADVLGAVADSFNLTIENLREIVKQVSVAARQVSQGSTENEAFARSLSADALRQAEELAVTLNSVQVMTDSIQRVAESAREAEEVARSASETALRGGEAVERTVAGILDIRETVADTTRKVKR